MKIRPPRGKAFVSLHEYPEKSKGGLLIPESVRTSEVMAEGTVIAVGPGNYTKDGTREIPPPVAVDDHVVMPPYGSVQVQPVAWEGDDKDRLVMVKTDDIQAVLEPEPSKGKAKK